MYASPDARVQKSMFITVNSHSCDVGHQSSGRSWGGAGSDGLVGPEKRLNCQYILQGKPCIIDVALISMTFRGLTNPDFPVDFAVADLNGSLNKKDV